MQNRFFIGKREDSVAFFQDVKKYGNFSSYKQLYPLLRINHSTFWLLQTGKRSFTQEIFELLIDFLPPDIQQKYRILLDVRPENWGEKLGGQITAQRHPNNIAKARLIANTKNSEAAENRFDTNQPLTTEIAEFLGAFSGDGFSNNTKSHYLIGFAGDSRHDLDYYQKNIIPITKRYFNIQKHRFRIEGNCMWINFYSKALFKMITRRFGIPTGVKFDKVRIPSEILDGKQEYQIAFIRGIFDTDGCVFFDNRKIYKTPYMRIDITMFNAPILTQLHQILAELGIESKVLGNGKHLQITSKKEVRKFLEKVGSSNQRHILKIKQKYPDFDNWNPA